MHKQTDWTVRSGKYEQLQWVKADATLGMMVKYASPPKNDWKLLDLGTGTGKVMEYFKHHFPAVKCFGIDFSQAMLDKIPPSVADKTFCQSVETLSNFDDCTFDVVTARMSVHHIDNPKAAFTEAHRVLKPGGRFIIAEGTPPNTECNAFYTEMFAYKEERHTIFSDDITDKLFRCGFGELEASTLYSENMSINNWLENADLTPEVIEIIKAFHYNAPQAVKDAYRMRITGDDIFMDWKFIVVKGVKHKL